MSDPYLVGAVVVAVVNGLAAVVGLAQWALGRPGAAFWFLARAGQGLAALYAVVAGITALVDGPPPDDLAWVYILTPIAVSYFAEQLRLVAATTVLERHGFESARELRAAVESGDHGTGDPTDPRGAAGEGEPGAGQRLATGIAHEVVLRELMVVATSAGVIAFLAWRAWLTG